MSERKPTPVLTERDRSVLRDLIESRVMTLAQITELHFDGKYEYAKKRFQRLKAADYVHERKPRHNPGRFYASMLSLARTGFTALADEEFASWDELRERLDLAESSLIHELEVVDMKVAFTKALRATPPLVLEEFSTFPRRFQFETQHLEQGNIFTLKPDGFARVSGSAGGEQAFFFEWDRSSEAHRKLAIKAFGYQRYFESGAFALWNGATVKERDAYPFTAIFILPNEERRNNTAEHLCRVKHPKSGARLDPGGLLLTTKGEFLSDPLGNIYLTLDAYRAATGGTPYDPKDHKTTARVIVRDRLVANRATLVDLMGDE